MNSNGTELEQVVHTHRTSCRSLMAERVWWPKLGPILTPEYCLLPSQWVIQSSLLYYPIHFHYGPNTCSQCTKVWHRTLSAMWLSTLEIGAMHARLFFRYRNGAEITVLICDQKPYQVWFSCPRKSSPVKQEQRLISLGWNIKKEES